MQAGDGFHFTGVGVCVDVGVGLGGVGVLLVEGVDNLLDVSLDGGGAEHVGFGVFPEADVAVDALADGDGFALTDDLVDADVVELVALGERGGWPEEPGADGKLAGALELGAGDWLLLGHGFLLFSKRRTPFDKLRAGVGRWRTRRSAGTVHYGLGARPFG